MISHDKLYNSPNRILRNGVFFPFLISNDLRSQYFKMEFKLCFRLIYLHPIRHTAMKKIALKLNHSPDTCQDPPLETTNLPSRSIKTIRTFVSHRTTSHCCRQWANPSITTSAAILNSYHRFHTQTSINCNYPLSSNTNSNWSASFWKSNVREVR